MSLNLHPSIACIDMPRRVAKLPRNDVGYPVPWFVAWFDGVPDFRVMDERKLVAAVKDRRCWVCGEKIGGPTVAFLIGPMCAVNRVSAEPPSHRECAEYSARACPFLANPKKRRRESHKPAESIDPAGVMIPRNPGVALIWITRSFHLEREGRGVLFRIGNPVRCLWITEGRDASRDEVMASITSGLPILRDMAEQDGPEAIAALEAMTTEALELVPA